MKYNFINDQRRRDLSIIITGMSVNAIALPDWASTTAHLLSPLFNGRVSLHFLWVLSLTRCYLPAAYIIFSLVSNLIPPPNILISSLAPVGKQQKIYESFLDDRKADGNVIL